MSSKDLEENGDGHDLELQSSRTNCMFCNLE